MEAQQSDDLVLRSETVVLPKTVDGIVAEFKRLIVLSHVMEIVVTPTGIKVSRNVPDGESVIPQAGDIPVFDIGVALTIVEASGNLELLPFDPELHPYLALERATRQITKRSFVPSFIAATTSADLSAYFALPDANPETLMGLKALYNEQQVQEGCVVVFGGRSLLFADITVGVVINLGF